MKLVTYSRKDSPNETHAGLVWGQWVLDIAQLPRTAKKLGVQQKGSAKTKFSKGYNSILSVLEAGPALLEELQELSWRVFNHLEKASEGEGVSRLADSTIHAPIPRPPTIRDFYGFEEHVKAARKKRGLEMVPEWYEFPAFYYSNPNATLGPDQDVSRPNYTKMLDFELEIACVIGRKGRDVSVSDAESFISGYTIMNDWSARDVQVGEMKIGLGPAKAKDFATSLGPWLVTPDELEDRREEPGKYRLEMQAKINGKVVSKGNMKSMHWTFPQMITRASESVELQPGDVIGSGTVGSGSLVEQPTERTRWLKPGDAVELSIERLGTLRNRVIDQKTSKPETISPKGSKAHA